VNVALFSLYNKLDPDICEVARKAEVATLALQVPTSVAWDGLNSFRVFLANASNDLQREKSRTFSVTSVAPARTTSIAISMEPAQPLPSQSISPSIMSWRLERTRLGAQSEDVWVLGGLAAGQA